MRRPLETTLGFAPAFSGRNELFWTHYSLEQILSLGKHTRYVAQSFYGAETTETAVNELGRSPERPQQGKAEGNGSKPMNFGDWRNASAVDSLQQSVRYLLLFPSMAVLARGPPQLASVRVQVLGGVGTISLFPQLPRRWLPLPRERKGAIALSQRWMRSFKF